MVVTVAGFLLLLAAVALLVEVMTKRPPYISIGFALGVLACLVFAWHGVVK